MFEKKYCDICGKEIKLFGNRKLEDGNMCKECSAKLSPWFSGRRHTRLQDIKEQLAYRQANSEKLKEFKPTVIIGSRYKFYIDEINRSFVVSDSSDYKYDNPDIISFDDVLGMNIKVDEDKDEIYFKDKEGNEISYDPPRYKYEYQFKVHMDINNPFFDEINFELSDKKPDSPDSQLYRDYVLMSQDLLSIISDNQFIDNQDEYEYNYESDKWYCPKCGNENYDQFCSKCGQKKPAEVVVRYCPKCGEKIVDNNARFCPKCGNKL